MTALILSLQFFPVNTLKRITAACAITCLAVLAAFAAPPRVDHILLEVRDLDRSIAFYRDQLGLVQKSRTGDFVTLDAENIGVFLWSKRWPWSPLPNDRRPPQGMYPHVVLPDVKVAVKRLRNAGYKVVADAKDFSYGTEAFVADPDGFVWALISK